MAEGLDRYRAARDGTVGALGELEALLRGDTVWHDADNDRAALARTIARLLTIGRDHLTKAETMTVATIESGVVLIAEPKALLGFAGPNVIKNTIRGELPEGFQTSEFLLEHGGLDLILDRREMRDRIAQLLRLLQKRPPLQAA